MRHHHLGLVARFKLRHSHASLVDVELFYSFVFYALEPTQELASAPKRTYRTVPYRMTDRSYVAYSMYRIIVLLSIMHTIHTYL